MPKRKRSKSRSRDYGKNGLPLPSTLTRKDVGKVMEDKSGNLKEVSKNLTWVNAEIVELTKTKSDKYYRLIDKYLDDEESIRDILIDVLEDVQPKVRRTL